MRGVHFYYQRSTRGGLFLGGRAPKHKKSLVISPPYNFAGICGVEVTPLVFVCANGTVFGSPAMRLGSHPPTLFPLVREREREREPNRERTK